MKNVCIVGYGNIGPTHSRALESIKEAKFYAVCDIEQEAIKRCLDKYEDVVVYHDFDSMLLDKNIDVIHICTPHYLHFEMIEKAVKEGKNVISEKPITMTSEEFEKLLKMKEVNKVCTVIQNRYNNCVKKLKEIIGSGELGDILAIKGFVTWKRDSDYYIKSDWRGKQATEGGSALINQSLHTLDLMIYLAGNVKSVQSSMHNYTLKDVIETEDTVEAYLQLENHVKGLFYATNTYAVNSDPEIEIVGTKAVAKYAYKKLTLNGKFITEDVMATNGKAYWGNGHTELFRDYYENHHFFSAHDMKNTMRTVFGMYESAYKNSAAVRIEDE